MLTFFKHSRKDQLEQTASMYGVSF